MDSDQNGKTIPEQHMAVASGPAGPVLAGPVLIVDFTSAHAQVINNTSVCLAINK